MNDHLWVLIPTAVTSWVIWLIILVTFIRARIDMIVFVIFPGALLPAVLTILAALYLFPPKP